MNTIEPTLQHTFSHDTVPGAPLKVSDLDFYNLLRRQADESRLFFNQRRAVIFDVEAIGTLRQQLIESLGIELAAGVLTRFGYTQGQGDADMLAQNFDWETDMDWLAAGPSLHMLEGIAHVQPEFIEFNRETGHFHMHGAWLNSYEAEEHLKRFGVSTQPVCWTLTGYASGYGTRFFGRELLAVETECVGKGDARCYWEIRPLDAWGAEAKPYRQALKKIDISSQLVKTNRQLQEQITERKQVEEVNAERARLNVFTAEVSLALTQGAVLSSMLQRCTEVMMKYLDAAFARIWTFNPTENMLELQASAGMYTHIDGPHARVPVGKFKIGLIAQERKAHLTNEVLHDPRVGDKAWAEREGMVAFAGYPLIVEDRLVGVMAMFARHELASGVLDAMRAVANMVALSIERKQAEETLQTSQKFLQDILDSMPSSIYVLDNQGRFMLINQVFAELFNLDKKAVIGKTDFDIFAQDTADEFQSNDLEILRTGVPVEVEEQLELADALHTYLTHKYPLRDINGKPYALAGISTNITERKKAEQTLAKRATELETIARVSTAAASLLDTNKLLQEVVDLTKQSFYLYHAHIYVLNTPTTLPLEGRSLVLAAGSGEVGPQMIAEGWAIPLEREHSLVAQAARTRQAVIVNDVRLNPDFLPNPLLPETRSEMAIPLMVGDNVLGVLDVQAEVVNRFTQEDVRIQTILAGQIAVALENARLFEQTQARARREQILREVTARVRSSVDADTIMRVAVQEVGKALGRPAFVYLGQGDKRPDEAEN